LLEAGLLGIRDRGLEGLLARRRRRGRGCRRIRGRGGASGRTGLLDQLRGVLAATLARGESGSARGRTGCGGASGAGALTKILEQAGAAEGIGAVAGAESFVLYLTNLRVAGPMPLLQLEVVAYGVVEYSHRGSGVDSSTG
jgi:hypothetical protein